MQCRWMGDTWLTWVGVLIVLFYGVVWMTCRGPSDELIEVEEELMGKKTENGLSAE